VKAVLVVLFALVATGVAGAAGPQGPQFRATVTGAGHRPVVGEGWRYVVRAVDARGRPVSGTAIVRVLVRGKVVDTVGWFGFRGQLRRTYRWSDELRGSRALLQVRVVGPGGSRYAGYSVRVVSYWPSVTGSPTFRTRFTGRNHRPVAGASWWYRVRAVNTNGTPFRGTAVLRVLERGRVVDTVGWFGFKGRLRRIYRWSPKLRGSTALLQVKVVGPGGTRASSYRVRVR
jgi:hypothetical protein